MNARRNPLVVHVIDELPPDGAERLLVDLLRRRSSRFDHAVVCLVREGPLAEEIRALGIPVHCLAGHGGFDPTLLWRLLRWLRVHRPQVVHTHLFLADAYGRLAARLAGVPAIFSTVHNVNAWRSPLHRLVDRVLIHASTGTIACTEEVGKVLRDHLHLPASRVHVVANGIDLQRLVALDTGAEVRAEFGLPKDTLLIAVVGRLHAQKGHSDLIEALAQLQTEKRWACLCIGSGDLRADLEAQRDALGLHERVFFTGLRKDVPRLLAAIDVLALPSRWEGLPIAMLEGMACGVAVLATRVGGVPDVIRDQEEGLLVEPRVPAQFAGALDRLLADATLRRALGERARALALARYDISRTMATYELLWSSALGIAPNLRVDVTPQVQR